MGCLCCCCKKPYPNTQEVRDLARRFGFTQGELQILWDKFQSYNALGKEYITVDEFVVLSVHGQESDIFLRLVFNLFDDDMTGSMYFTEFLQAMYHFMTLNVEDLELFTFQIFDLDGGGTLEPEEINFMISVLWGTHLSQSKVDHIREELEALDSDMSGAVDAGEWLDIARKFPNLLFPAFSLQEALRERSLSASRWQALTHMRNQVDKKKCYVDVRQISETQRKVAAGNSFLALKNLGKLPPAIERKVKEAEAIRANELHMRRLNKELGRPIDYHHEKHPQKKYYTGEHIADNKRMDLGGKHYQLESQSVEYEAHTKHGHVEYTKINHKKTHAGHGGAAVPHSSMPAGVPNPHEMAARGEKLGGVVTHSPKHPHPSQHNASHHAVVAIGGAHHGHSSELDSRQHPEIKHKHGHH